MEPKKVIIIDLAEYGAEGQVVLAKPNFRKKNELMNVLGRCTKNAHGGEDGKFTADEIAYGDMLIANAMSYVTKSPFEQNIKGFLEYTDRLDENEPGAGERLFDDIQEKIQEIDAYSPLSSSQPAETGSSERGSSTTRS